MALSNPIFAVAAFSVVSLGATGVAYMDAVQKTNDKQTQIDTLSKKVTSLESSVSTLSVSYIFFIIRALEG